MLRFISKATVRHSYVIEGWADAEASYREALRLNPNYANAKNDLSKLLKKLGKEDAAP